MDKLKWKRRNNKIGEFVIGLENIKLKIKKGKRKIFKIQCENGKLRKKL